MADFKQAKQEVLDTLDHSLFVTGFGGVEEKLKYGDYVVSGMSTSGIQTVGYVVQIRKEWGAFGSTMFFVRDQNGDLATHENQSFWKLTEKQIDLVKTFFKYDPDKELAENPDLTYSIACDHRQSGFIVSSDDAFDRVDSCAMAISVIKN